MSIQLIDVLVESTGGVGVRVHAQPRSSRNVLVGLVADGQGVVSLKIAVTAPPVEGAANAAIESILADALHISKGRVTVVKGTSGRHKRVAVVGLSQSEVTHLLSAALGLPP